MWCTPVYCQNKQTFFTNFLHLYLYLFVHALLILLSYFLYKVLPIMPSNLWKMQPAVVVCLDCLGEETSS